MKVLLIGEGGRESAIAMKLSEDPRISKMYFAKGNATTEILGENICETDVKALRDFALKEKIDLTIVGPEATLVEGIVDEFNTHELNIFGPKAAVAKLEGSKAFSKKFMQEHGIKTAKAVVFNSYEEANQYIKNQQYPLVIKASGLAAGKGVVICQNIEDAETTLEDFMIRKIYGDAGIQVVIEEFLQGFETSIIAFSNGEKFFPCVSVKDYKRVGNGNTGPNTGGMGTIAPSPQFTEEHFEDFRKNILEPTLNGLKKEYLQFKGFIFFGLMVTENGCYLLEYNMRMGDPETQCIMSLMENNLLDVIQDCLEGEDVELKFKNEKAVCLVMCSGGYPRNIETGFEITGLDKVNHSQVLFAGASYKGEKIVTTGGRVLNIIATGITYEEARRKVYEDALTINFDYGFYREDIGSI